MNFQQLDLNLLRVLTVLYRTRSVTQSSRELALSQPATSHALARLRESLQDELFVRTPKGLSATRFCDLIAPSVQQQLSAIEQTLQGPAPFDPSTQAVDWRVSLSDLGEMMFLPQLVARLRQLAPRSNIANVSVSADEVPKALENRTIDLAVGILHTRHKGIRSHPLFQENYVALTSREAYPGQGRKLSLEQFRNARLVIASPDATFHRGVDKVLRDLQIASRVSVRSKHFGAIPQLVQSSDLMAIVPRMYAESVCRSHANIKLWNLPVDALGYTVNVLWHTSTESDSSQAWLRAQVVNLFERHHSSIGAMTPKRR
jgi:DNA-binding transcriptional LysR family regulator